MGESWIFDVIFRGIGDLDPVKTDLQELLAINLRLQNESLEYQKAFRAASAERKKAADEARSALVSQINAELGIKKEQQSQLGIIEQLRARVKALKSERDSANSVESIQKYNNALIVTQAELNKLTGVTDKFRGSNGFWREMSGYIAATFATQQLYAYGEALVKNEAYLEAQRLALKNVVGSQNDYINSLALLDKLSDKYGQDITILTESYKSYIAASNESGLSLKERNRIYESIVKSGASLKLTNEQIEGSLLAVSQMFSKGNVQAEELRGQLGERLPGAFGLAAKAMGVTESKLNDMLKQGQVLAVDLLPKLATELEKTYGSKAAENVNTLVGATNRYFNSVKEYFGEINKSYGITEKIANVFNYLADNLKGVVGVLGSLTTTLVSYAVSSKLAAGASAAWTAIEKVGLIIKGEYILLTRQQSIANATLTDTQLTAAAAAQTFNNTLLKNPIGLVVLAIGTLVTAYQFYSASQEKAREEQEKLNKQIGDAIAPLELQKRTFNELANEVLKGNVPLQKQYEVLESLKKQYPDLLTGVNTLAEAEKILNAHKISVNAQDSYRLEKLAELKRQYPEQLKGINDLKDAEIKLSGIMKEVNSDFLVRAFLLEAEIKSNINKEKAIKLINEQSIAEEKLKNIKNALAIEEKNNLPGHEEYIASLREQKKQYEAVIRIQKEGVAHLIGVNADIQKLQEDQRKKLHYNYDEQVKTTKDGENKKTKIKADSAATQALIQEKSANDSLEKTRVTEQKSLQLQRDIDVQRVKDSTLKAQEKASKILKIESEYFAKSSQLTNKYDEEEQKQADERVKNQIKIDKKLEENFQKSADNKLKVTVKNAEEIQKIDVKNAREYNKLQEDKQELTEKLAMLDRLSQAKSAEEIVKIKREETEKKLTEDRNYYLVANQLANIRLNQIKTIYGEDSIEYKKQKTVVLQLEQDLTTATIKLVENKSEKVKEATADEVKTLKTALEFIGEVSNQIFGVFERNIQKESEATTDLVKKARLENAKQFIEIEKGLLSVVGSLATGDIMGAVTKGVGVLFNAIDYAINEKQKIAEAKLAKVRADLQEYIDQTREQVDGILGTFERIEAVYGTKMQMPDFGSASIEKAIEAEIKLGEKIVSNYNQAVEKENQHYQTAIDNRNKIAENDSKRINETFDLEVKRINEKYAIIGQKAEQQYNAETMAIMQQGAGQLEALITNEESLTSVRAEFAKKRADINQIFALADKKLGEDATQAEIDAVNAAIKARDEALAQLQDWYNKELAIIIDNEDQKRTEYSATEKIQNEINERLSLAALQYKADEIQREQDKAAELVKVEQDRAETLKAIEVKKLADIAIITADHNKVLTDLALAKDKAIAESFARLKDLIVAQIAQIQIAMNKAITSNYDEYVKLAGILTEVLGLYRAITGEEAKVTYPTRGGNTTPITPTDAGTPPPTTKGPRGYKTGIERVPRESGKPGRDTELAYLDAGERIFSTEENDTLKTHFGRDIKNKDIVKFIISAGDIDKNIKAAIKKTDIFWKMSSNAPVINYPAMSNLHQININHENKLFSGLRQELSAMSGKLDKLDKLKQVNVEIVNGIPSLTEIQGNRMIKHA